MIRRIPIRSGDAIACKLASALSIENDEAAIESSTLDLCREFAFSAENAEDFGLWYQRSECFSKFQTSNQSDDRKRVAIDKFYKAEKLADDANHRLVYPKHRDRSHTSMEMFPTEMAQGYRALAHEPSARLSE